MAIQSFDASQAAAQITRYVANYIPGWIPDWGTPISVTYGFRAYAPDGAPGWWNDYPGDDTGGFQRFTDKQIATAEAALALWADVSNITFTRIDTVADSKGVLKYTNPSDANLMFANWSSGTSTSGGRGYWGWTDPPFMRHSMVWMNAKVPDILETTLLSGANGLSLYLHEIGHALALSHPDDYIGRPFSFPYSEYALYAEDTYQYTLMSYFSETNTGASFAPVYPMSPMLHDVAAMQKLYGANMGTRAGDTIYGFNSNVGSASDPLNPYIFKSSADQRVFCVWDAGGTDTFDFSKYTSSSTIDLREGAFSSVGGLVKNISIAFGAIIENATGGLGADKLIGNAANNVLTGLRGNDTMTGDAGHDTFVYSGEGADIILDFGFGGGADIIRVTGVYTTFAELQARASHINFGLDTRIDFGNGNSLTLKNYNTTLSTEDFEFVSTVPEIAVAVSGQSIADNSTTISIVDGTDFGTVVIGSDIVQAYKVNNIGGGELATSSLKLPKGFILVEGLSTSIAPGGFDTFTVRLDTIQAGLKAGQITFATNDADENPFNFSVTAVVVNAPQPEIAVTGNGFNIADNDTTPDAADHTQFGNVAVGGPGVIRTFTVSNAGIGALFIANFAIPTGFILVEGLSASIAPAGFDTFQVQIDTSVAGSRSGQISFTTNDPDENPFNVSFTGIVTVPVNGFVLATAAREPFFGSAGIDTVSYYDAPLGVVASLLAPSKNTAFAAGDTYDSIENLIGSAFADRLTGNVQDNVLEGGALADALDGGLGADTASYEHSSSGVIANMTNTKANTGDAAGDTYKSIENMIGSSYDDSLTGSKVANVIFGGDGEDLITGGGGPDTLVGAAGLDQFRFASSKDIGSTISDFAPGEDKIAIVKAGFKISSAVALNTGDAFDFGLHYFDRNADGTPSELGHGQFIFNEITHQLLWDPDGLGKAPSVVVAAFANDPILTSNDFVLV